MFTLANKYDKLRMVYVLSDEEWMGIESGYISAKLIRKYIPAGEYSVFICGPRVYDSQ